MRQMPAPKSDGSPYIPVMTYTTDCAAVITIPNTAKKRGVASAAGSVSMRFAFCRTVAAHNFQ